MPSYDLSTSSKWASLSSQAHSVKLRAKGTGYGSSSFSNSVTVTKGVAMPAKGDLITIESKQYRVLKTNGSVAEVLAMYDASSQKFDISSSYYNTYAGKNIDTYCNNTFYNGLSSAMKGAIVDKTFTQDEWLWSSSVPTSSHYTGKYGSSTYYVTLTNAAFGTSITRHCYVLSIQDVLDYLDATTSMGISDTTLTDINIWKMVWNQTTSPGSTNSWLRSAYSGNSSLAFYVRGYVGSLDSDFVDNTYAVRPAFQIDLSKIEWTPVGVTEHTLTFSGVKVTVDGGSVTRPYTLTKDCTIVAYYILEDGAVIVNGTSYSQSTTLNLSNTDISISGVNGSSSEFITVTINYTV